MSKPTQDGWRDISTAPKDGTNILYSGETDGIIPWVTCGRWTEDGWYEINLDDSDVHGHADYPTMWQPLPSPPSENHATEPRETLRDAASLVIAAARCIRHWHNTGRNDEGTVVSTEKVIALWDALEKYDAAIAKAEAPQTAQPHPEVTWLCRFHPTNSPKRPLEAMQGRRRQKVSDNQAPYCQICDALNKPYAPSVAICNETNKRVCEFHQWYCVEEGHGTHALETRASDDQR